MKKEKILRNVMFVICLAIFLFAGIQLFKIFAEYKAGTDAYGDAAKSVETVAGDVDELQPVVEPEPVKTSTATKYTTEEIVSVDVDWTDLPEAVIGWIQINDDEMINYPVVQSTDNEYYLYHLPDGTNNSAGSIFVDYRNEGFSNRHVCIYGHNMKNGSMFSHVKKYRDQAYADEHRYVYVVTPDGATHVYYVYSCQITDALGEADGFNAYTVSFDGDEWQQWIAKTQEKSLITSDIELPEKCNIITLSTCMSRGVETERCVIHAVEISNTRLVEQ